MTAQLPFAEREFEARQAALWAAMEDANLDGLLLFNQESLYYLYGYDQIGYWVYQTFVVPRGGQPVAICRRADEMIVRGSPWVADVKVWMDDSDVDPGDLTRSVLEELDLLGPSRRIGVEMKTHALLPYYYAMVSSRLAGAVELVDVSDIVTELRIRKSPQEMVYLREASVIMDAGFKAGLREARAGVRECDIHAAICDAMYRAGGELPAVPPPIASGPRTLTQTHGGATERRLEPGEAVTIEVGGVRKRYHTVALRSAHVGTPPPEIVRLHDGLTAALRAGLAAVRPGMRSAELARVTLDELERHGYDRRRRHVGYGTGIGYPPTWLDSLRIKESDTHTLDPGTSVFLFLGAFTPDGSNYLGIGDPILVTEDGVERLTTMEHDLFLLPQ
jgi:Xaa-Pro dipeptidase